MGGSITTHEQRSCIAFEYNNSLALPPGHKDVLAYLLNGGEDLLNGREAWGAAISEAFVTRNQECKGEC